MDPVERELNAHEAQASATAVAVLLFLWGAASVFIVPSRFRVIDATHAIVGAIGFGWFVATRRRPQALVAYLFTAAAIAESLIVLPWITRAWCAIGRPFEAVNVPQIGMLTVALIVPRSVVLGVIVMLAFLGQGLFVTFYAHHVGVEARLPIGDPAVTALFALPAIGLLLLRDRRRQLGRRHIRLQAETETLDRLGPLFNDVRAELTTQLSVLRAELDQLDASHTQASMSRSVARLVDVDAKLSGLVDGTSPRSAGDGAGEPGQPGAATELERRFLAADEQLGGVVFALLMLLLGFAWVPFGYRELGLAGAATLGAAGLTGAVVLAVLLATRRHPSSRRGRIAQLVLFVVLLVGASINQYTYMRVGRPFDPFVGHKVLMLILGLVSASWASVGLPLIVLTAAEALALYYALGFGAIKDRIALVEPWVTLVFMAIAITALLLRDQRRLASLAVLRAESRSSALHRRASMLLALRDQLNTPLQTLVLGATRLALQAPATADASRIGTAIARLVQLSRELATLEIPVESQAASVADDELHRAHPAHS